MAHLFIVDETTFKIHLEYMFAGTGAKEVPTDFIFNPNYDWGSNFSKKQITFNEKRSVDMMTDLCRIRKNDKIIFFVQGISKFFGIFRAKDDFFVDPNDKDNFLKNELGKILTYRILIEPDEVYEKGVSEFDYLDLLEGIEHPDQLCWSLIYRKLGANRGCTMITEAEFELFKKRLKSVEGNKIIKSENLSYDKKNKLIIATNSAHSYSGRKINVENYLYANTNKKYNQGFAFEHYLQHLTIRKLKSNDYSDILHNNGNITWLGNEVMCSVGEHRIDVLAIQELNETVDISIIELKYTEIPDGIIEQLNKYIYWVKYYIVPYYKRKGKKVNVYPIVICSNILTKHKARTINKLKDLEEKVEKTDWSMYNDSQYIVNNAKIIHFIYDGKNISIQKK